MTGTFSSLNTALSALRYNRVAMDVASGNIANVATDGYARRRVDGVAVAGSTQAAMWSRYDGAGDGVAVRGIQRMTDVLLDARVRAEHGNQHYFDVRRTVLERVEQGIGEPGDNGVSAALAQFRSSWHDLANNPANGAARSQVLARGATLAGALATQSRNIDSEAGAQRVGLLSAVDEVNSLAGSLADTNRAIAVGNLNGTDVGVLLDSRDMLTLRLSELTGSTATIRTDGGADVTVRGVSLVSGKDAGTLTITSGVTPSGGADGSPVSFSIVNAGVPTAVVGTLGGEAGAVVELLDTTLPGYRAGLDAVARELADTVNTAHQSGYDSAGNPGAAFFSYDPTAAASTLAVALTDPAQVAASSVPGGGLDSGNADRIGAAGSAEGRYQQLVSGFGTTVLSARRASANQQALTNQFDSAREQLAGVNLDEEMVNMMSAQRAYEAAARVLNTLDSVMDTLINRTGLVR